MIQSYVDKLVALKPVALSLFNISPEFFIDQLKLLLDLSYTFSQYLITCDFDSGKPRREQ